MHVLTHLTTNTTLCCSAATAHKHTQLGSTAIGVLTKEGVVLAVEKRITSPLLVRLCSCVQLCMSGWCFPFEAA